MSRWRRLGDSWCLWPAQPKALVEFIGGSYLAATPQLSYRRLLEGLAAQGLAVHAWSYVPGFDHQLQARQAWDGFRSSRALLRQRIEDLPPSLRLGHSLGCKLHLLAPDGGRNSAGLISLSFNNFSADRSIPLLSTLAPSLGVTTEFSPGPEETLRLVERYYHCPRNLVVRFGEDSLDQSHALFDSLCSRSGDQSEWLQLAGDHLTPASAGLRQGLLGDWADDPGRSRRIQTLIDAIIRWQSGLG
ncbi:MAG: DUF1350 domain-containing protein [Synechococcaceae bacterium WB9_4xB_025]|jgi:hypothetical protein|nr:DUF1350 domain-containing protein [Synechococcaceae bacterium WB9_4xB_025]